jgi:hypothetical protein
MVKNSILVIISSGERKKVLTAMMYAWNTKKFEWLENVRVMFFGPAEKLLTEDSEVASQAARLAEIMEPIACKYLADKDELTGLIEDMGIKVDYVGSMIADHIKNGYIPMVW